MAALLDFGRWPAWRPGLEAATPPSDVPLVVGAAWAETRPLAGRTLRLAAHAAQVEPHAFAYTLAGDGLEATLRWELRPDGDGTLATQTCTARPKGIAARLAGLAALFVEGQAGGLEALAREAAAPRARASAGVTLA